jgi:hypothetical protein
MGIFNKVKKAFGKSPLKAHLGKVTEQEMLHRNNQRIS